MGKAFGRMDATSIREIEDFVTATAERLPRLMDARGVTVTELANRLGIGEDRLGRILDGRETASLDVLARLLAAIDGGNGVKAPTVSDVWAFMRASPLVGADLDTERDRSLPRSVDL